MTVTDQDSSPAADFAALMSSAREQADFAAADAPFGYTKGGQPRKKPGRPRNLPPSLEELKGSEAPGAAAGEGEEAGSGETPPEPAADRAPDEGRRRTRRSRTAAAASPAPPYRAGVITNGVNRIYRRTGKIVRAMDSDIGTAIIESATNTAGPGEPDDSVGAAWDELARTNPRIRRFILKCLAGGAWGQLVFAHAPIGMAIVMKPAIARRIPFMGLIESLAEPDEDTPPGEGGLPGGMTAADAQQMADLARQQAARMGLSLSPETAAAMAQMAQNMMGPQLVPSAAPGGAAASPARHQPRRPAGRAARKKAG